MAWRKVWKRRRKGVRKDAWLIRWYDDSGKMQAKTLHGTADEAEEECRRMEQELNDGSLGRRQKVHWLDFCERYLADLASCRRPRTVEDYQKVLEALTADYRPQRPDELTPHRLREFVRRRTVECSPATRNKLIRTLRAILSWAVPEYLKENPAKRVKFAEEPEQDHRTLTPAELLKVLGQADLRGQAVLLLGTCCGLRREEIATLRWQELDEVAGRVYIKNSPWHITKSGQQRCVLMPPALIEVLGKLKGRWEASLSSPKSIRATGSSLSRCGRTGLVGTAMGLRRGRGRLEARRDRLAGHPRLPAAGPPDRPRSSHGPYPATGEAGRAGPLHHARPATDLLHVPGGLRDGHPGRPEAGRALQPGGDR